MNIAVHGGRDAGVTQQLLQDFGLHSALNGAGSVCMAQSVHTETFDPCIVAQLVEVSVVGAVLGGHSGAPVDEHQITHNQLSLLTSLTIHNGQDSGQVSRFLAVFSGVVDFPQDIVSGVSQRNRAVAGFRFRRASAPHALLVTILQSFVDGQSVLFPINSIPCQTDQCVSLFPESAHTERSYGNAWRHSKTVSAQRRSESGYHQVHERALCSGHRPLGVWQ